MAESRPKMRSIDFLTPEQLRRKREGDRKSQKHSRERTKAHISSLETSIHELQKRNQALESHLSSLSNRCSCGGILPSDNRQSEEPQGSWHSNSRSSSTVAEQYSNVSCSSIVAQSPADCKKEEWGNHLGFGEIAQMIDDNHLGQPDTVSLMVKY